MVSTLKLLREHHNYTQAFVAETVLGISQNTYSRLEASPGKITAEQAQKLSLFYKVSVAHLLSEVVPVISFIYPAKDGTEQNKPGQRSSDNAQEKELAFLKQELDYFKKQNQELLKLLGEKTTEY